MNPDWRRLATVVQQRRRELGLTQEAVRARGGPSTATMRMLEGGHQESYRPGILADLERALQWTAGSVEAILAGGDPVVAPPPDPAGRTSNMRRWDDSRPAARDDRYDALTDDADIRLVMDSDLPESDKHEIVRELLAERTVERRRRVELAHKFISRFRRVNGE